MQLRVPCILGGQLAFGPEGKDLGAHHRRRRRRHLQRNSENNQNKWLDRWQRQAHRKCGCDTSLTHRHSPIQRNNRSWWGNAVLDLLPQVSELDLAVFDLLRKFSWTGTASGAAALYGGDLEDSRKSFIH